jgi:8-oxo-dGTP diphosphatase
MTDAQPSPMPLQIAVAVVENDGQFLIGLRPDGVPLAGLWEFPGGKVEPGETSENAAIRECLEEAGLTVRIIGEYPPASHSYQHATAHLRFFACELTHPPDELPARFRWVTPAELCQYSFPPANAELLKQVAHKGGA